MRRFLLLALALTCFLGRAAAQAQFAGTYIGIITTKVTVAGFSIENSVGAFIAVVDTTGGINVSGGQLTGTLAASGVVTFASNALGITNASIANQRLGSEYGALVANNTTQYKLGGTSFTAPTGGGGGAGGGGTVTTGDLLAYYSFNDASNLYKDDSGRGVTLNPVNGVVSQTAGKVGGALLTNGTRLRALVNSTFSSSAMTIAFYVRPDGPGDWNPRLVAVGVPGQSQHYYGAFLNGLTSTRTLAFLANSQIAVAQSSKSSLVNGTWKHVAVTFESGTIRYYIDGALDTSIATGKALTSLSSAMLMIAGSDNGLDLFQGALDEVRIYNRALTAAEVTTLSNGGAVGTAVTGSGLQGTVTAEVIAAPTNLTGYRSRVGQSFQFSVTGASSGTVYGTDVYSDDSSIARAAVHAGVMAPGEVKTLTVSILSGQSSYTGSTRNSVTSQSSGATAGSFSFAGATGANVGTVATTAPTLTTGFVAANLSILPGGRLVLPISVSGVGPFTFQWFLNGITVAGATSNPYVVESVSAIHAGAYTVRVTNAAGSQLFSAGTVAVATSASAPQIVLQPFDKVVAPGGTFALATSASGTGLIYQWFRNGVLLAGETGAILLRQNVAASDAGQYSVRVTNSAGVVTSTAGSVSVDANASRLVNVSGRINLDAGARMIPGFTISGSGKKRVLIRAVGPTLSSLFNVPGAMADPRLEVYSGSTKIAENNDWSAADSATIASVGAFPLAAGSKDAAVVVDLDANKGYTVQLFSNTGSGGVVLFEVYDVTNVGGASKFTNIAVRGPSGTGERTLILGFVLSGSGKRTLLTRGVGPKLIDLGVPNVLADPKLEIYDGASHVVLSNDDWSSADFVNEMLQAREFVGAFALDGGSADASTLALLDPGSYTVQITAGSGTASGEALAEIYEVP